MHLRLRYRYSIPCLLAFSFIICAIPNSVCASSKKTKTKKSDSKGQAEVPVKNPFDLPITASLESRTIGSEIFTFIEGGSYIFPSFSPDGRFLVFLQEPSELEDPQTLIHVLNMNTRKRHILFNSSLYRKYGLPVYFSNFLPNFVWWEGDKFCISFSDGDVDSIDFTFDVKKRKIIKKEETIGGPEDPMLNQTLSKDKQKIKNQVLKLFPSYPKEELFYMLRNFEYAAGNNRILLEKKEGRHVVDTWWMDFGTKKRKKLISALKRNYPYRNEYFLGGVPFSDSAILLLMSEDSKTHLFLNKNNHIERIGEFSSYKNRSSRLNAIYQSDNRAVFQIELFPIYIKSNNPLFLYTDKKIYRVTDYGNLDIVSMDKGGRFIAFNYYEDDKKHIAVKRVKPGILKMAE